MAATKFIHELLPVHDLASPRFLSADFDHLLDLVAQRSSALVPFFQQSEPFADHFARRLVLTARHTIGDEAFVVRGQ